jgi:hypothetical protein
MRPHGPRNGLLADHFGRDQSFPQRALAGLGQHGVAGAGVVRIGLAGARLISSRTWKSLKLMP